MTDPTPPAGVSRETAALMKVIAQHVGPLQRRVEELEEVVRRLLLAERDRHE